MKGIERFLVDGDDDDIRNRTFPTHQKMEVARLEMNQLDEAQVPQQESSNCTTHGDQTDKGPAPPLPRGRFPGEHVLYTRLAPDGYSVARTSCSRAFKAGDNWASMAGVIKPTPSRSCICTRSLRRKLVSFIFTRSATEMMEKPFPYPAR